jgi:hypothetical protein
MGGAALSRLAHVSMEYRQASGPEKRQFALRPGQRRSRPGKPSHMLAPQV